MTERKIKIKKQFELGIKLFSHGAERGLRSEGYTVKIASVHLTLTEINVLISRNSQNILSGAKRTCIMSK